MLHASEGPDAVNPAWVLSEGGHDIVAALHGAGFAARAMDDTAAATAATAAVASCDVTPPLVVVDLRGGLTPAVVRGMRADARVPLLAVTDAPDVALAAARAGANETLSTADLDGRFAEIANLLLRMATLW